MAKPASASNKRKRGAKEHKEDEPVDFNHLLEAHGERFMQSFDDHDSCEQLPGSQGLGGAPAGMLDPAGPSPLGLMSTARDGEGRSNDRAGQAPMDSIAHQLSSVPWLPATGTRVVREGSQAHAARRQLSQGHISTPRASAIAAISSAPSRRSVAAEASASARQRRAGPHSADPEGLQEERRRFMSPKAHVVLGASTQQQQQPGMQPRRRRSEVMGLSLEDEGKGLSRDEFLQMQREVHVLGATTLDKRARKSFDAAMLARLGAKAAARPRIPASIGRGMARKQAQREQLALQEGIAAGMVQQKGLGKKKRRERERTRGTDRGLMEDGGAFKPGLLRVKAPPRTPHRPASSKLRRSSR